MNVAKLKTLLWDDGETRSAAARFLTDHKLKLAVLIALLLPLKLSIAYVVVIPSVLLWVYVALPDLEGRVLRSGALALPLFVFVALAGLSAFLGINPLNSFTHLASVCFFGITILFFAEVSREHGPLTPAVALIAGQTIAATHSALEGAFPGVIKNFFLGAVTESGQLGMVVPLALALVIFLDERFGGDSAAFGIGRPATIGVLNGAAWALFAFSESFGMPIEQRTICCVAILGTNMFLAWRILGRKHAAFEARVYATLVAIALPLLVCALLVNLKRGPWAGVLVASSVFIWFFRKRWLIPIAAVCALSVVTLAPVRDRIVQSADHFYISGGRSAIWNIGGELALRYPLGLGFKNSGFLRHFSTEIPRQLTHFHNNLLNILVENGWIAFGAFGWWLFVLGKASFRGRGARAERESILAIGLGCALLSWQIAGVVEYNFGDSEVLLIAFALVGLLTDIARRLDEAAPRGR